MDSFDYLEGGTIVAERYRIVSPLASGGFGAVYVAEQLATDRTVALKMLWPHLVHGGVERFSMEARIAGRLNSENIVQVLDAGMDAERRAPFLVMELLQGSDLEMLVERTGALEPARALEYLRQAAIGLDKAHTFVDRDGRPSPIVHRDLKPGNLFLSRRDDGTELVKILDFGIAKVLSSSKSLSGGIRGTPLYMAYEQAAQAPITPAADIWSFGLIAFFLLTGKSYWKAAQDSEQVLTRLFAEVLTLPLDPPSARARELGTSVTLPPAFDAWFARVVNRDPSARIPSTGQAVRELAIALELEPPITSGRASFSPRSHTPTPVSTGTDVALQPSAAALSQPAPPSQALATSDLAALGRTQGSASRGRRVWLIAAIPGVLLAVSLVVVLFFRARFPGDWRGVADKATAQPSETAPPAEPNFRPSPLATPRPEDTPDRPVVSPIVPGSAAQPPQQAAPRPRALAGKPRTVPASRPPPKASVNAVPGRSGAPRDTNGRDPNDKPPSIYGVR